MGLVAAGHREGIDYTFRMKRILLAAMVCLSAPALAADDSEYTIKVIGEDGSVQVLDLRQAPNAPDPLPHPAEPAAPEVPSPAPVKEEVSAVPPVPKAERAPKAAAAPAPQKAAKKPAVKKAVVKAAPPPPPQAVKPPPLPVQRQAAPGRPPVITRGKAISIALGYAPPSSDVEVFRSDYQGQEVYAVIFKTEDGFHEVLIDDQTGKVLESRESAYFQSRSSRPGHLPDELR